MAFGFGGGMEAAKLVIALSVTSGPAMKALGDVQAKMGQIGTAMKSSLGGPLQGAMDIFGQIGDAADGVRSVAGAINNVMGRMVMGAAQMETFSMQFRVLLGSAEAADARIADLYDYAATTPFEMPGIVEASRLLQTFTDGALASGDGLRMVGDIAAGTGRSIEDVAFKVGRMYDAFRSGTNIGESLMYLQEMGAISGDSRRKIEALANAVKNGSMTMEDAWSKATKEFGRFGGMTEALAQTTEGKLSTAIDAINMGLAKLGEKFLPMVKSALDLVVVGMDAFNFVAEKAAKYWFVIAPFAGVAAKAFMGYARATVMAKIATMGLAFSMKTLWKAVLGPIGLIIAGLELLELAWNENFLGIRDIVEGVFKWIKDNFGWLIDLIGGVTRMLGQAVDAIGRVATGTQASGNVMIGTMKEIESVNEKTGEKVTETLRYMGTSWVKVADEAKASGAAIVQTATYVRDNYRLDEAVAAAEKAASEMRKAAAIGFAGLYEKAAEARKKLRAEMEAMTAEAVTAALAHRKAVADALSGAMDVATGERFAKLAVAAAKREGEEVEAALKENRARIREIRKGGVTDAEQTQLETLEAEKAGLKDRAAAAELAYQKALSDLSAYGDAATRASRLAATMQAGAYAEGLSSKDPLVRANTLHTMALVYKEIRKLRDEASGYGASTVVAWVEGMAGKTEYVRNRVGEVVKAARGAFKATSPPGPESPLHLIDVWGFKTGQAWAEGMAQGVQTLDLSKMPSPEGYAMPVSAPTWAAGASGGRGAIPAAGAVGGGLVLQLNFQSAVPYTPAEQNELGQRVGPAVYEYLRSRGAV